jgi:hypothetical protein
MSTIRFPRLAIAAAALASLSAPALADTLYQSATYTGVDTGEYILNSNNIMGGVFTLSGKTDITAIGAQFGGFPAGEIFGAIVRVDPATGLPAGPSNDIAAIALGHATFAVTSGTHDQSVALPLTLDAGIYAVVFGTNQFGATGFAGLGAQNDPVADPSLIRSFFSTDWDSFNDDIRIFVEGTPAAVPEAATWGLMLVGFGAVGAGMRMRRRTVRFA